MKTIYINNRPTVVKTIIGEGQEAVVYKLSPTTVVKVYRQPDDPYYQGNTIEQKGATVRLKAIRQKLQAFPQGLPKNIIAPSALVYDDKNTVIGYTMPYIDKAHTMLQYGDKIFRTQNNIDNNIIIEVFKHLHKSLSALHQKGVVVGDFNDMNILVKNALPYFIDSDSWQFDKFICSMYTDKFVDPLLCHQITNNGIETMVLHKPHNALSDWYAFAVLLWKALLFVDPYGGIYKPKDKQKNIKQHLRPLQRITVMHPDIIYPKHAYPYKVLPPSLLDWMTQVLVHNKREIFPYHLLEQITWKSCKNCGIEYATHKCPSCNSNYIAAPQIVYNNITINEIFRTKGTIVYTTVANNTLQYVRYENNIFYRENGEIVAQGILDPNITFRIQGKKTYMMNNNIITCYEPNQTPRIYTTDHVGNKSSFDVNHTETCYVENGKIIKELPSLIGTKKVYVGQGMENNTIIWLGDKKGFGFYKAGNIFKGILIPDGERYTITVDLPRIQGSIIDIQCIQSHERYWLLFRTKRNSEYYNVCIAINEVGVVIGQHECLADDTSWLGSIYGKTAVGKHLFNPTDQGIVRISCDYSVFQEHIFTSTEPFVHNKCQLLVCSTGIYIITAQTIKIISIQ